MVKSIIYFEFNFQVLGGGGTREAGVDIGADISHDVDLSTETQS